MGAKDSSRVWTLHGRRASSTLHFQGDSLESRNHRPFSCEPQCLARTQMAGAH